MKLKIKTADAFGELMRDNIFAGKQGYKGCSTFDVEEGFEPLKNPEEELAVKLLHALMAHDGDYELDALGEVEFMQDYPGIKAYSNGSQHCMYLFDGDVMLLVADDELKLAAVSDDAKKDHNWKWVEWK